MVLDIITKGGFGGLKPEQFILKRLSEVVYPLKFQFRVAGPMPIAVNLDDDGLGQMGYIISTQGSSLNKRVTMLVPKEDFEHHIEARRIAEAYGNMILDAAVQQKQQEKVIKP